MEVIVNSGYAGASVSTTKLRLSVSVVNPEVSVEAVTLQVDASSATPVANVSAMVAAANIDYILMMADAFLDVKGLYPYYVDLIQASDALAKGFASGKSDQISQSDEVDSIQFGKGLTEDKVTQESHTFDSSKRLDDVSVTSETLVRSLATSRSDSFTQSDESAFLLAKDFEERKWAADGQSPAYTYASIDYFAGDYVVEYLPEFHFFKGLTELLDATDDFLGETNIDDDQTVAFVKSLTDVATLIENVGYVLVTSRSDAFAATDLETRSFDKARVDTSGTSDANTFNLATAKQDGAVSTDSLENHLRKPLADAAASTDDLVHLLGKALSDSASHSDLTTTAFIKALADTSALSDFQTVIVGKALADLTSQSESHTFDIQKVLSDVVDATDDFQGEANLDDDQVFVFGTTKTDSVTPTDSALLTAGKNTADTADASDSGSLYMTDYCDISYFAEPYVGTYATF